MSERHNHRAQLEHLRDEWGTLGVAHVLLEEVPPEQIGAVLADLNARYSSYLDAEPSDPDDDPRQGLPLKPAGTGWATAVCTALAVIVVVALFAVTVWHAVDSQTKTDREKQRTQQAVATAQARDAEKQTELARNCAHDEVDPLYCMDRVGLGR